MRLLQKKEGGSLPEDEDALNEEIRKNRKGALAEWIALLKVFSGLSRF